MSKHKYQVKVVDLLARIQTEGLPVREDLYLELLNKIPAESGLGNTEYVGFLAIYRYALSCEKHGFSQGDLSECVRIVRSVTGIRPNVIGGLKRLERIHDTLVASCSDVSECYSGIFKSWGIVGYFAGARVDFLTHYPFSVAVKVVRPIRLFGVGF